MKLLYLTLLLAISAGAFLLPQNMLRPFQLFLNSDKEANQAIEPATLPITYRRCYNLIHIDRSSVQQYGGAGGMFWEPLFVENVTPSRTVQVCGNYKCAETTKTTVHPPTAM
ncbi:uncharacterized protein BO88DRAFT_474909 [Aspergillus vadensis CBS 113365]|uniref:Uncharacterized protein n=1 Tax=Aspergillus vadensis (strain CBS 113365 / IMI 142717 / IBT 24658) TaxID=1448311 RepID=A0A319AVG6_ASPVC|nr:hypothetical protein BO88DRAFT_474909 [Aspergillus vadensis CBS 113365]PYH64249.1 hypothetical protein BO88DRAFT_474909 [Aspergillus vadensis CBS 113365]